MTKVTIEVDGKSLPAQAGEMLICVTDRNDIYIPRFCYHEKLSIAANCRMCLVEVERAPKPLPACATPVMDGMKVFTRSKYAQAAQQGTMEFLLINHPLDCPVCDQGGECPLQDQAMGYGNDDSRFLERKRSLPSHDIGPLVATEMTRCIHCTRCVRFGEEVAGVMEMGAPGRGEFMQIGTFLNRSIDSEVSGNMIDLCPVGALTSKPYRFAARSWELQNHPGISPHDCLGTNINIQTLRDQVERVLPIDNPEINQCWLADRDRYSYEAVNSEQRLTRPMIKDGSEWREVDWKTALNHATAGMTTALDSGTGNDLGNNIGKGIGGLAAATSTLEEFYLLQKLMRSMGSDNVDHRLQQCDFRDDNIAPRFPASEVQIQHYNDLAAVLLVGSNIRKEQPLLALRLRDGCNKKGTKISAINPVDFDFNFDTVESDVAAGGQMVRSLAALAARVAHIKSAEPPFDIKKIADSDSRFEQTAKNIVAAGENGLIIIGALAQQHTDASLLKAISQWICDTTGCKLAVLGCANSAAGWIARCVPGDNGMNAGQMLGQHGSTEQGSAGLRCFVLLGTEPELDSIDGKSALAALNKAEFIVQISAFKSASVMQYADVLLPMAAFTESAGTYINCEGRIQNAKVAATPKGEARPGWKILRVMGNFLGLNGFEQVTIDDVTGEINLTDIAPSCRLVELQFHPALSYSEKGTPDFVESSPLTRVVDIPMYRAEVTLRHAQALQQTADNPPPAASLNPVTATGLQLNDGAQVKVQNESGSATLQLRTSDRIAENCVYVPAGFMETAGLGGHVMVTVEAIE
ncbi:NADH-quinone oxidoreductase subunit NuoG [Candidatus Spongiihabitans sp.]|uniref:NADH-quinone oxidoreductase subunit NuoG n=1 Tax=Candidatus Spongiihabitans sp. TaxID=3101308 RepID=UPI003C703BD1